MRGACERRRCEREGEAQARHGAAHAQTDVDSALTGLNVYGPNLYVELQPLPLAGANASESVSMLDGGRLLDWQDEEGWALC